MIKRLLGQSKEVNGWLYRLLTLGNQQDLAGSLHRSVLGLGTNLRSTPLSPSTLSLLLRAGPPRLASHVEQRYHPGIVEVLKFTGVTRHSAVFT